MNLNLKAQLKQLRETEPALGIGDVVIAPETDADSQLDNAEVLREKLNLLATAVTENVDVRQTVEEVYRMMQMHPGLAELLRPEDCGNLVRHLRELRANRIRLAEVRATRKTERQKKQGLSESFLSDIAADLDL